MGGHKKTCRKRGRFLCFLGRQIRLTSEHKSYRIILNITEKKGGFATCRSATLFSIAELPLCTFTVFVSRPRCAMSLSACSTPNWNWKPMPDALCSCAKIATGLSKRSNKKAVTEVVTAFCFMRSWGACGSGTRPVFLSCCRAFPGPQGNGRHPPCAGRRPR